jgi:hypothetical protein
MKVVNPSSQDRTPRRAIVLPVSAAAAPYRASGLVLWHETVMAVLSPQVRYEEVNDVALLRSEDRVCPVRDARDLRSGLILAILRNWATGRSSRHARICGKAADAPRVIPCTGNPRNPARNALAVSQVFLVSRSAFRRRECKMDRAVGAFYLCTLLNLAR